MHYEDSIYKIKTFINELQKVQDTYFIQLTDKLNLNEKGQDYLFDYIFNCDDQNIDDFTHYLMEFECTYKEMMKEQNSITSDFIPSDNISLEINNTGEFYDPSEQISYEILSTDTTK